MKYFDTHIFTGLRQDVAISKHLPLYLTDAKNIRITARDNETLMSITNEKGPLPLNIFFPGDYLGHCIIDKYLVVFTLKTTKTMSGEILDTTDYIARYDFENDITIPLVVASVNNSTTGGLNFSKDYPIETLSIYENKFILKVYWVDGLNLPRVINIVKPELLDCTFNETTYEFDENPYNLDEFNFVNELSLQESLDVEKVASTNAVFMPGTILYAITYYHKYGLETNIAYVSPIYYISPLDRGGNPEERVSNAFHITINNVDNSHGFDYLRIYSIHRAAEDTSPRIAIVGDFLIKNQDTITTIDNGMYEQYVDPSYLLYVGGEEIIANTLCLKDNTCFFGDIHRDALIVPESVKNYLTQNANTSYTLEDKINRNTAILSLVSRKIYAGSKDIGMYYRYSSQLSYKNNNGFLVNPTTFKTGELYRFGILFQYKNGKWSEPIWVADQLIKLSKEFKPFISEEIYNNTNETSTFVSIPLLNYILPSTYSKLLYDAGFRKARGLVVLPKFSERIVVAQGMLCPTVFNYHYRNNHTPDSLASWFLRPFPANLENVNNEENILKGATVQWKNNYTLYSFADRGAEILGVPKVWSNLNILNIPDRQTIYIEPNTYEGSKIVDKNNKTNLFAVDQSVVTMHSPDFEFDTQFFNTDTIDIKIRLSGTIPFISSIGDIDIVTNTPAIGTDSVGFEHRTLGIPIDESDKYSTSRSLVSGLFYSDYFVDDDSKDTDYSFVPLKEEKYPFMYMVYPWHKTGSLNNDVVRPADKGVRTAELKEKKISNLKYSKDILWFDNPIEESDSPTPIDPTTNYEIRGFYNHSLSFKAPEMNISTNGNQMTEYDSELYEIVQIASTMQGREDETHRFALIRFGDTILSSQHRNLMICDELGRPQSDTVYDAYNVYLGVDLDEMGNYSYTRRVILVLKDGNNYIGLGGYEHWFNGDNSHKYFLPSLSDNSFITDSTDENFIIFRLSDFSFQSVNKSDEDESSTDITTVSFHTTSMEYFNELLMALKKLKSEEGEYNYYGNVDTIVIPPVPYSTILTTGDTNRINTTRFYPNFEAPQTNMLYASKNKWWNVSDDTQVPDSEGGHAVGDNNNGLRMSRDLIRMKYKSGPHYVFGFTGNNLHRVALILKNAENPNILDYPFLFLAEMYRDMDKMIHFGGHKETDLLKNIWIPAGEAISISQNNDTQIEYKYGDTWYQRYDCLKTYPYTMDDTNSIIEIGSFMCETRINIDGRYDRNRGQISNLYMSPLNFNLMNNVYNLSDNFFNYKLLDNDFYKVLDFPNTLTWTLLKSPGELIDQWTKITLANTLNMDGEKGPITALKTFNNEVYCFLEKALNRILFNSRVQVPVSDGVPIELTNSYKVDGKIPVSDYVGCLNKFSICTTPAAMYFIDSVEKHLYAFGDRLLDLSDNHAMSLWFKNQRNALWKPNDFTEKTFYNQGNQDLYIVTENDCLCYSEKLGEFVSFYSYENVPAMFDMYPDFYCLRISDMFGHAVLMARPIRLYKMFSGYYNIFFGLYYPYYIEFISNGVSELNNLSLIDKIFNTVEMRADKWDDYIGGTISTPGKTSWLPFNTVHVWNEFLDSGEIPLTWLNCKPADAKKKFRVWRILLPRDKANKFNRIRNTWCKIKFESKLDENATSTPVIQLHDLSTVYYT